MSPKLTFSSRLTTDSGRALTVESFVGGGGQGKVYRARLESHNRPVALKLFHESHATAKTKKRIKYLAQLQLDRLDSSICAPFETVTEGKLVGHIAPFVEGPTLLESLEEASLTYREVVDVALQIARLTQRIMNKGITHGDLQTQNFKIRRQYNRVQVFMIDLDNYLALGVPRPNMIGMTLYLAPEIRQKLKRDQRVCPTKESDLYAFGVLMHEVLLHFHPIAGFDQTIDEIDKSMLQGWIYDPENEKSPENPHGYPVRILNPEITDLIRKSLSPKPSDRPNIDVWVMALENASQNVSECPSCRIPFISYAARTECPYEHEAKGSTLQLENGQEIQLKNLATVIGRQDLEGSAQVSRRHLIVRRIGLALYIESIGMNPTRLRRGDTWERLKNRTTTLLQPDDQLLVADTLIRYVR